MPRKKTRQYTVVGYYSDNNQPYASCVRAANAKDAALSCANKNGDLVIVDAFLGKQKSVLCNETTFNRDTINDTIFSDGGN